MWPRNSRNSTKAGLSSMLPNNSSSDVCGGRNRRKRGNERTTEFKARVTNELSRWKT